MPKTIFDKRLIVGLRPSIVNAPDRLIKSDKTSAALET